MENQKKQDLRVALVTGAAKRMGSIIVEQLHQAGYHVAIHCHHSYQEAQLLANQLNQVRKDSATVIVVDLCQDNMANSLINKVITWRGQLDLLVNNASVFIKSELQRPDKSVWDKLFVTNVQAPFYLSLAARAYLALQKGAIVNITDIHAERPLKGYVEYCQSKAALLMQTKALAREFAPDIRVNAVAPGAMIWPEGENELTLKLKEEIIAKTPLKKHGDGHFIAEAVLFLAENQFITGQILNVDGGRSI